MKENSLSGLVTKLALIATLSIGSVSGCDSKKNDYRSSQPAATEIADPIDVNKLEEKVMARAGEIFLQGGYYNTPPDGEKESVTKIIPYFFNKGTDNLPSISTIEQQMIAAVSAEMGKKATPIYAKFDNESITMTVKSGKDVYTLKQKCDMMRTYDAAVDINKMLKETGVLDQERIKQIGQKYKVAIEVSNELGYGGPNTRRITISTDQNNPFARLRYLANTNTLKK